MTTFVLQRALNSSEKGCETAGAWARLLRGSVAQRGAWLNASAVHVLYHHRVPWPQSAYVRNDTFTACLPTMLADVQAILGRMLPGCVLPAILQNRKKHPGAHSVSPSESLCSIVQQLYPSDFELWRLRCVQRNM